jgi:hypothetical protein
MPFFISPKLGACHHLTLLKHYIAKNGAKLPTEMSFETLEGKLY